MIRGCSRIRVFAVIITAAVTARGRVCRIFMVGVLLLLLLLMMMMEKKMSCMAMAMAMAMVMVVVVVVIFHVVIR